LLADKKSISAYPPAGIVKEISSAPGHTLFVASCAIATVYSELAENIT
jgi:hypothetical protein